MGSCPDLHVRSISRASPLRFLNFSLSGLAFITLLLFQVKLIFWFVCQLPRSNSASTLYKLSPCCTLEIDPCDVKHYIVIANSRFEKNYLCPSSSQDIAAQKRRHPPAEPRMSHLFVASVVVWNVNILLPLVYSLPRVACHFHYSSLTLVQQSKQRIASITRAWSTLPLSMTFRTWNHAEYGIV